MLKKIKKYKISLRPSVITKTVRKKLKLEKVSDAFEKIIETELHKIEPSLQPSALYISFNRSQTPGSIASIWNQSSNKSLSLSLLAVTIGLQFEKDIFDAEKRDELRSAIREAIGWEAVDQSAGFVLKLLNEEAKLEAGECSPILPIEPALLKDSLLILESQKAGITLAEQGQISPFYTRTAFCFWNPISKK